MKSDAIGFVGLGLIGSAMARRLITQGHQVIGHDIESARVDAMAGDEFGQQPMRAR